MKLEDGVLIDEIEELSRAQHKAEDDLARLQVLAPAVDDSGLDQRYHIVGDHLGVNAEILAVHQIGQNRVGDCAYPTL